MGPEFFYSVGKFSGLIGFFFLAILIISGDLSRPLDRLFGLDKIIKFQRTFSYFTLLFVLAHPIFFMLSSQTIVPFLLPDFTYLPLALGTISLYIFLLVMIASKLYKLISYRVWQYIHILTYILFGLSLFHAFNQGSDANLLVIRIIYFALFVCVLSGAVYRLYYKIYHKKFRGKVIGVDEESQDTFTLTVSLDKKINFKPGQFCFLSLNKDRLYARHPFTIASAPGESVLRFSIKNYGRFTKALKSLTPDEVIMIEGPFGIFTPDLTQNRPLVFIAGGVGITPFMSILRQAKMVNQTTAPITLFYSVKTHGDLLFESELNELKVSWFDQVFIFSQESGRLTKDLLLQKITDPNLPQYYICGPIKMKEDIVKDLKSMGVSNSQIFFEDFFW